MSFNNLSDVDISPKKSERHEAISVTLVALKRKINAFYELTRPWNWLRMQVPMAICGAILFASGFPSLNIILICLIAGASLSASGYAINDYFDRNIDIINVPDRPIPSNRIAPIEALFIAVFLSGIGIVISLFLSWINVIIAAATAIYGFIYAIFLKRFGNILDTASFAVFMGFPVLYGAFSTSMNKTSLVLAFAVAIYIGGAHIIGTIKDIEGDRESSCRTVAVVFGSKKAAKIASGLTTISLILFWIFTIYFLGNFLSFLGLAVISAFVLISLIRLIHNQSKQRAKEILSLQKTFLFAIFIVLTLLKLLNSLVDIN
ncbi:MAG: hypothetical protein FIA99_01465 [Ruminiclostridium sp.]|nr:hypothetical protein [Ruminiclostridium sp.]